MTNNYSIAVVGLGAVGSAACIQLLRRIRHAAPAAAFRICCFETRAQAVGAGLAYATKHDFHVLNMRSHTMSLFPELPDDFADWLAARGLAAADQDYAPRHLFGAYVKARLDEVIATHAAPGVSLEIFHDEVVDCDERPDAVVLSTKSQTFVFDHVILSVGHLAPKRARPTRCPWSAESYDAVAAGDRVGILGSGLSAIDVMLTLENRGFRGPIVCVSRQRLLPKVQSDAPPVPAKHLTKAALSALSAGFTRKLSLSDVMRLLHLEFLEFEHGELLWRQMFEEQAGDVVFALEDALAQAAGGRVVWHTILDATTAVISDLWSCLDDRAKLRFLRIYEAHWAMFRHSMPPANARQILAIARQGRLGVHRGLKAIRHDGAAGPFTLTLRGKSASHPIVVDHLFDATGVPFDLKRTQSPLLERMRGRGQLVQHPLGGVDVDFDSSRLIFADGRIARRIMFVGVQTKGVHFYTNSFEMNRDRVFGAVDSLLQAIASQSMRPQTASFRPSGPNIGLDESQS